MKYLMLILGILSMTGCVNHYRYTSTGSVVTVNGAEKEAHLYWFADHGWLFFRKHYSFIDGDISMNVCNVFPRYFTLNDEGSEHEYSVRAQSGDRKVAELNQDTDEVEKVEPKPIRVGSDCGYLDFEDDYVEVTILCESLHLENEVVSGAYQFSEVEKIKVTGNPAPELDCPVE